MIAIIDNGSQYTHLIKRTCKYLGYSAEILRPTISMEELFEKKPEKIIISGGPSSVYKEPKERINIPLIKKAYEENLALLGICYGHQLMAYFFGGIVEKGESAEYGITTIIIDKENDIFRNIPKKFNAWVSHFDEVKKLPEEFEPLAHSEKCRYEAMKHKTKPLYSLQFHPEVWHTENGEKILENFLKL